LPETAITESCLREAHPTTIQPKGEADMVTAEEKKLIESFKPIRPDKADDYHWYALNETYCINGESSLIRSLANKAYIRYGDNDFLWHLTKRGWLEYQKRGKGADKVYY